MGWNSATHYFDDTIHAAKEVLEEYFNQTLAKELLLRIARPLSEHLCNGDWDVQNESDFWHELGPDLWPERYEDYLLEMEENEL